MKLNRVRMFARRISATERLVRSPPAFVSPRERRSATWALVRPAGGVSAIGAAGAGGDEAAASAMPDHRVAVDDRQQAGPGLSPGTGGVDSGGSAHTSPCQAACGHGSAVTGPLRARG